MVRKKKLVGPCLLLWTINPYLFLWWPSTSVFIQFSFPPLSEEACMEFNLLIQKKEEQAFNKCLSSCWRTCRAGSLCRHKKVIDKHPCCFMKRELSQLILSLERRIRTQCSAVQFITVSSEMSTVSWEMQAFQYHEKWTSARHCLRLLSYVVTQNSTCLSSKLTHQKKMQVSQQLYVKICPSWCMWWCSASPQSIHRERKKFVEHL